MCWQWTTLKINIVPILKLPQLSCQVRTLQDIIEQKHHRSEGTFLLIILEIERVKLYERTYLALHVPYCLLDLHSQSELHEKQYKLL